MRKRISSVLVPFLLVCILSSQTIQAAEQRASYRLPSLSFQGTTATCSVVCRGNSKTDELDVTLTLYQGRSYVDSWSDSGKGSVILSKECQVVSGKTYRLEVSCSINGEEKPVESVTATCP